MIKRVQEMRKLKIIYHKVQIIFLMLIYFKQQNFIKILKVVKIKPFSEDIMIKCQENGILQINFIRREIYISLIWLKQFLKMYLTICNKFIKIFLFFYLFMYILIFFNCLFLDLRLKEALVPMSNKYRKLTRIYKIVEAQ